MAWPRFPGQRLGQRTELRPERLACQQPSTCEEEEFDLLSTHRPRQRAHECRGLALWCHYKEEEFAFLFDAQAQKLVVVCCRLPRERNSGAVAGRTRQEHNFLFYFPQNSEKLPTLCATPETGLTVVGSLATPARVPTAANCLDTTMSEPTFAQKWSGEFAIVPRERSSTYCPRQLESSRFCFWRAGRAVGWHAVPGSVGHSTVVWRCGGP